MRMQSVRIFYKKYTFLVNLVIAILLVSIIILILKIPHKISYFYPGNTDLITEIDITNGNTGETIEITDAEQISKLMDILGSQKVRRVLFSNRASGWSYRFRFQSKDRIPLLDLVTTGNKIEIDHKEYKFDGINVKEILQELNY